MSEPQRFEFTVGDDKYAVTNAGDGIMTDSAGATHRFHLPLDKGFDVEELSYFDMKGDLILIYGVTDQDAAGGEVVRLDRKTLKQIWLASVPGFNLGEAVLKGHWLYLTAIGFVGKLDVDSGKYLWRHDNLYDKEPGTFNSFERPFLEKEVVKFTEVRHDKGEPVTIIVEDQTGHIISPW